MTPVLHQIKPKNWTSHYVSDSTTDRYFGEAQLKDPGILICPTQYPDATLYVITSESNRESVDFRDMRSGREFMGTLASGRAAILLVGADGKLLATFNWPSQ